MNRLELEHIIRAAGAIVQTDEFIVIGSQSILGGYPNISNRTILLSEEADLIPPGDDQETRDLIDGSIGEASRFHRTFGIYAQGVSYETAVLPKDWQNRLVPVGGENTRGVIGWCLDPHDLVLAKYAAGRDKDYEFNREVIKEGLVDKNILLKRLLTMTLSESRKKSIQIAISSEFSRFWPKNMRPETEERD